jgi:heme/copper-type cytochrome/quinol oxidase subunit 2
MGIDSIDGIVSIIRPFIPQLIVSIIGIIGIFITNRLKNADKDKAKNSWRIFLRIHKVVDNCLADYYGARYPPPNKIVFMLSTISSILGTISGVLLSIIVMANVNRYVVDLYKTLFYTSFIVTLISGICIIIVAYYNDSKVKKDELLSSYKKIDSIANYLLWLDCVSNVLIISLYLLSTESGKNYTDLVSILIMFIGFIFAIIYLKTDSLDSLKLELTRKYAKKFPRVLITTNVGEISGRIYNIFNEDVFLLDDDGCKVAVEWNHIILLRVIDGNTYNV